MGNTRILLFRWIIHVLVPRIVVVRLPASGFRDEGLDHNLGLKLNLEVKVGGVRRGGTLA
jgi:hypothetical protein